jgi:hypothetical protein
MRTENIEAYGKTGAKTLIKGRVVNSKTQRLRFSVNATDFLAVIGVINIEHRYEKLRTMVKGRRWTPWEDATRIIAPALRREGLTPIEIRRHLVVDFGLDVPCSTVYFWVSHRAESWEAYSGRRRPSEVGPKINTNGPEADAGPVA